MNEMQELFWAKVLSAFLWIAGGLVILVSFSYVEFIANFYQIKRKQVLKARHLKRAFIIGVLLVIVGVGASLMLNFISPKP